MNYQDSIKQLYNEQGKELFSNPIMLKSLLLDYVKNNPSDRILINAITKLLTDCQIVDYLTTNELEVTRNGLINIYHNYNNYECNEEEFIKAINPLLEVFYPDDYINVSSIVENISCDEEYQDNSNETNDTKTITTKKKKKKTKLLPEFPEPEIIYPNERTKLQKKICKIKNGKDFDQVSIHSSSKNITVIPWNGNEIFVNDELGNDVTSKVYKIKYGCAFIQVLGMKCLDKKYYVHLPLKDYAELYITSLGKINVCSVNNDILNIKRVKIESNPYFNNGKNYNINLSVNTDDLTIDTRFSKKIYLSGDITNMKIKSTYDNTNVNAYINPLVRRKPSKIEMDLKGGDINLITDSTSLVSQIKGTTLQKGNGSTCKFINKIKEVDLITKNGEINVFENV